jgi:hypothetical protein
MPDAKDAITAKVVKGSDSYLTQWKNKFPTATEWTKASSVFFGIRGNDRVLGRIDELVAAVNEKQDDVVEQRFLLGFLYFATDHWLKHAGAGFGGKDRKEVGSADINTGRLDAVYALFRITVDKLCNLLTNAVGGGSFGVTPNTLPEYLARMFGKDILLGKLHQDIWEKSARYVDEAERLKYRLQFKGGQAYMYAPNGNGNAKGNLVLANSAQYAPKGKEFYPEMVDETQTGWAGFALSMAGEFYMAPHVTAGAGQRASLYHSSYFAGKGVLCAGTIKIVNGKVVGISNGSGHYAPSAREVVTAVQMLVTHGVSQNGITVWVYPADHGVTVRAFMDASYQRAMNNMHTHMAAFVAGRGRIQQAEALYTSRQEKLNALYADRTVYQNLLDWKIKKCPSPKKTQMPIEDCTCRWCDDRRQKPEWRQADKVRRHMQLHRLGAQFLKDMLTIVDARIEDLKTLPEWAVPAAGHA